MYPLAWLHTVSRLAISARKTDCFYFGFDTSMVLCFSSKVNLIFHNFEIFLHRQDTCSPLILPQYGIFNMLFYPCNICLLTEFQYNSRSNVVLFKDLYSSFPLFDRVFFKKITLHTLSWFFIFVCLTMNFVHFNFIYMKFISFWFIIKHEYLLFIRYKFSHF